MILSVGGRVEATLLGSTALADDRLKGGDGRAQLLLLLAYVLNQYVRVANLRAQIRLAVLLQMRHFHCAPLYGIWTTQVGRLLVRIYL